MDNIQEKQGPKEYRYAAFISYRHADNKGEGRQWASWLHHALETYDIPEDLVGTINGRGEAIPEKIFPVFRDEEELPADSDLGQSITKALDRSQILVVLCSPRATESKYVNDEIDYFKRSGGSDSIIAAIIDGEPNISIDSAKQTENLDSSFECFPRALQVLYDENGPTEQIAEPIATDFRLPGEAPAQGFTNMAAYRRHLKVDGRLSNKQIDEYVAKYKEKHDLMFLKIVAAILGIPLGMLTKRDKAYQLAQAQRRAKVLRRWVSAITTLAIVAVSAGIFAFMQRDIALKNEIEAISQRNSAMDRETLLIVERANQQYELNQFFNAKNMALRAVSAAEDGSERRLIPAASVALSKADTENRQTLAHPFNGDTQILETAKSNEIVLGVSRLNRGWEYDTDDDDEISLKYFRETSFLSWKDDENPIGVSINAPVLDVLSIEDSPYYIVDIFGEPSRKVSLSDDGHLIEHGFCGDFGVGEHSLDYLAYLEGFRLNANDHLTSSVLGDYWIKRNLGAIYVCNLKSGESVKIDTVYEYLTTGVNRVFYVQPDKALPPRIIKRAPSSQPCRIETIDVNGNLINEITVTKEQCEVFGSRWIEESNGQFYDAYFGNSVSLCESAEFHLLAASSESLLGKCGNDIISSDGHSANTQEISEQLADKAHLSFPLTLIIGDQSVDIIHLTNHKRKSIPLSGKVQALKTLAHSDTTYFEEHRVNERGLPEVKLHFVYVMDEEIVHHIATPRLYEDELTDSDVSSFVQCSSSDGLLQIIRLSLNNSLYLIDRTPNAQFFSKVNAFGELQTCQIANNHLWIAVDAKQGNEYLQLLFKAMPAEQGSFPYDLHFRTDRFAIPQLSVDGNHMLDNGQLIKIRDNTLATFGAKNQGIKTHLGSPYDFLNWLINPTNNEQIAVFQKFRLEGQKTTKVDIFDPAGLGPTLYFDDQAFEHSQFSNDGNWIVASEKSDNHVLINTSTYATTFFTSDCKNLIAIVVAGPESGADWYFVCANQIFAVNGASKTAIPLNSPEIVNAQNSVQTEDVLNDFFDGYSSRFNEVQRVNDTLIIKRGGSFYSLSSNMLHMKKLGNTTYKMDEFIATQDAVFSFSSQEYPIYQADLDFLALCNLSRDSIRLMPENDDLQITGMTKYKNGVLVFLDEVYGNAKPGSYIAYVTLEPGCHEGSSPRVQIIETDETSIKTRLTAKDVVSLDAHEMLLIKKNLYQFSPEQNAMVLIAVLEHEDFVIPTENQNWLWSIHSEYALQDSMTRGFVGVFGALPVSIKDVVSQYGQNNEHRTIKWSTHTFSQLDAIKYYTLGEQYFFGDGVEQDYQEAVTWYKKAAELGDADGQFALGVMYVNGLGVIRDEIEAMQWFRKAAEQGHAPSQTNIGSMYAFGQGVSQDYTEAAMWYRKAAENNFAAAQTNLGSLYLYGYGVQQDNQTAYTLFSQAAEQGYGDAQANLGVMYMRGMGVEQDNQKAAQWFTKSAKQGNAYAQFNLGLLYENGYGLEVNLVRAYAYYKLASAQNLEQAKARAEALELTLPPELIEKASMIANLCLESSYSECAL